MRLTSLALAATLMIGTGCSSITTEPGTTRYTPAAGTLHAAELATLDVAVRATVDAMDELEMHPVIRDKDGFAALVSGESVFGALAQSHEVRVHLESVSDSVTTFRFRVLGRRDRLRLERLHAEIQKKIASAGEVAAR